MFLLVFVQIKFLLIIISDLFIDCFKIVFFLFYLISAPVTLSLFHASECFSLFIYIMGFILSSNIKKWWVKRIGMNLLCLSFLVCRFRGYVLHMIRYYMWNIARSAITPSAFHFLFMLQSHSIMVSFNVSNCHQFLFS